LSSAIAWRNLLYAPIYTQIIDAAIRWLFGWRNHNIATSQKIAAYAHLYSCASVKSVVHWFRIMRHSAFIMYDDYAISLAATSYRPARFPTRNIVTPIMLVYGDSDSLVDIDALLRVLPEDAVVKRLCGYEHLDVLWGREVHIDVIPVVLDALKKFYKDAK
jgi:lysosomal acid lipase/cholesteryl ester hydrolase